MINRLPSDVVFDIIGDWSDLLDIAGLDTAICNQTFRPVFLELLCDNRLIQCSTCLKSDKHRLRWLIKRGVVVKYLNLDTFTDLITSVCFRTYSCNLRQIKHIKTIFCSTSTPKVLDSCNTIKYLDLSQFIAEGL